MCEPEIKNSTSALSFQHLQDKIPPPQPSAFGIMQFPPSPSLWQARFIADRVSNDEQPRNVAAIARGEERREGMCSLSLLTFNF